MAALLLLPLMLVSSLLQWRVAAASPLEDALISVLTADRASHDATTEILHGSVGEVRLPVEETETDDSALSSVAAWIVNALPGYRSFSSAPTDDGDDDTRRVLMPCVALTCNGTAALKITPRHVLIFEHSEEALDYLRSHADLRFDSLVYLARLIEGRTLEIREAYSVEGNRDSFVVNLAEKWNCSAACELFYSADHIWERRGDLRGMEMTTLVSDNPPFTGVEYGDDGTISAATGFDPALLEILAARMNFTLDYVEHPIVFELIEQFLNNGSINLSAVFLFVTGSRMNTFAFTQSVFSLRNVIATNLQMVEGGGGGGGNVLSIFRLEVWLLGATVCAALLMASWVLTPQSASGEYFTSIYGAMLNQGSPLDLRRPSERILLLTTLLYGLLALTGLSARLVSTLSVRQPANPIKSLHAIRDHNLDLYMMAGGYAESAFRDAHPGTVSRDLYEHNIKLVELAESNEYEVLQRLLRMSKPSAMLVHPTVFGLYTASNRETGCKLTAHEVSDQIEVAIPLRKNSPYVRAVDYQLTKIRQEGILDHLYDVWYNPKTLDRQYICGSDDQREDDTWEVDLKGTAYSFALLLGGATVSMGIVLCERIWRN